MVDNESAKKDDMQGKPLAVDGDESRNTDCKSAPVNLHTDGSQRAIDGKKSHVGQNNNQDEVKPERADMGIVADVSSNLCSVGTKMTQAQHMKNFAVSTEIIKEKLKLMDLEDCRKATRNALRFLITALGNILQSQPAKQWHNPINRTLLAAIMRFWNHDAPSVRGTLVSMLRTVLMNPDSLQNGFHPRAKTVGKFVLLEMRKEAMSSRLLFSRLLTVVGAIAGEMPAKTAIQLADRIVRNCSDIPASDQCAAFRCIYAVFRRKSSNAEFTPKKRQAQLRRLAASLRKCQPASASSSVELWLNALVEAHVLIAKEDPSNADMLGEILAICINLSARRSKPLGESLRALLRELFAICIQGNSSVAVKCFETLVRSLTTDNAAVLIFVLNAMSGLFDVAKTSVLGAKEDPGNADVLCEALAICIKLSARRSKPLGQALHALLSSLFGNCIQGNTSIAVKCLEILVRSLATDNTAVLKFALKAMAGLFDTAKASVLGDVFDNTLRRLVVVHEADDDVVALSEEVIGCAIRNVGMKRVLSVINIWRNATDSSQKRGASLLGIDPEAPQLPVDLPHSWLLRVLKENIRNESLSIFVNDILPAVTQMRNRLVPLHPTTVQLYSTIESQMWDLLPSFLKSAPDFSKVFPDLAQKLVAIFSERADLRLKVLASIQTAINSSSNRPDWVSTMASCAKHLLPKLVSFYLSASECDDNKAVTQAVLRTVRLYASLAPPNLLVSVAKGAIRHIKNRSMSEEEKRHVHACELLTAVVKHASSNALTTMIGVVRAWLSSEEPMLVKQAYRLLEEMSFRVNEDELWSFFNENVTLVSDVIKWNTRNAIPTALRLGVYRWILVAMTDYSKARKFGNYACGEILRCLDKSNSRCIRKLAEKCFDEMCFTLVAFGMDPQSKVSLKRTLKVIYRLASPTPDLAGNDASKIKAVPAATARSKLLAMLNVAKKDVPLFTPCQLERFVDDACAAVKDTRRSVRLLAMAVIRVLCERLPVEKLNEYKHRILDSVFDSSSWNVRTIIRYATSDAAGRLFEALVDAFGRNDVMATEDRLFKLLEKNIMLNKLRRRLPRERRQPQSDLRRRSVQGLEGDKWDDLRNQYNFTGDDQDAVKHIGKLAYRELTGYCGSSAQKPRLKRCGSSCMSAFRKACVYQRSIYL